MSLPQDDEHIVLVDEDGHELGIAPKLASHHDQTPLHKAFSCYVFDEAGRLLVTQRAHHKKVWPSVWTNSFCGHPRRGETDEAAIRRRAEHELGATVRDITVILPRYRYKTPPYNSIVENELCPVYVALREGDIAKNPDEVHATEWVDWHQYVHDVTTHPGNYSYWAIDQLAQLQASDVFNAWLAQFNTK